MHICRSYSEFISGKIGHSDRIPINSVDFHKSALRFNSRTIGIAPPLNQMRDQKTFRLCRTAI